MPTNNATKPHPTDPRATWETYASAWKHADEQEQRTALAAACAATCIYRDPLTQAEGHDALLAYMRSFHQQVPGGHFETTDFLAHHQRSIARWHMKTGDGAVVGEGTSYGEYDARGMLVAMTGFFAVPSE